MARAALFLDLGGTLVRTENGAVHLDSAGRVELLPRVLGTLTHAPFEVLLVVTNQSGIERGLVRPAEVHGWIEQLNAVLAGRITDYWACPALDSPFRKPSPAMVSALADKHFIDLGQSLMVGDAESDRACAASAGVRFEWARDYFGWAPPGS